MKLTVTVGDNGVTLNSELLKKQGCDYNETATILGLHAHKMLIHDELRGDILEREPQLAEFIVEDLTKIEFALQRAWGFPQSMAYHRFWETPKCTCPKMDNEEQYATKQFIIMANCPLHGDNTGFRSTMESQ